jgi:hypothetical protein
MKNCVVVALLCCSFISSAQNDRVNDLNNTNWLQGLATIGLGKSWGLHLEYQWRRVNGLKDWQQSLVRVAGNYKLNDNVSLHAGYAWAETFTYGDYPIAPAGNFPEHRIYEQLTLKQPFKKLSFNHRFRIEQRWLGKLRPGTDREIDSWTFLHRFRYQLRMQYPFWASEEKQFYGVGADEIFIGAGKNLGVNIFDQNRLFLMLGFKFNKTLSVEGGYFNQTLQQGRRINNGSNTVLQKNNGIMVSSLLTL